METIKNQKFGGERPLFGVHDVRLEDIEIVDGESGIKCCKQEDSGLFVGTLALEVVEVHLETVALA